MDGSLPEYSTNLLKSAVGRASRVSVLTKVGSVCTGKVAQPDQKPRAESGPEIFFSGCQVLKPLRLFCSRSAAN